MRNEYDFSQGKRGKYSKQITKDLVFVQIEPDIAKEFPNSESVNKALRTLLNNNSSSHKKSK